MTLEAMKMEHSINAPQKEIVSDVHFKFYEMVDEGIELITLTSEGD